MKARLLKKGLSVSIYALEHHNKCEVFEFINTNKHIKCYNIPGFVKIINTIADEGYIFPKDVFKTWNEQGVLFSEIIKGDYRISCFKYEIGAKKLLLVTHFGKTRNKQKDEYKKAINLKELFDRKPLWEIEDEKIN